MEEKKLKKKKIVLSNHDMNIKSIKILSIVFKQKISSLDSLVITFIKTLSDQMLIYCFHNNTRISGFSSNSVIFQNAQKTHFAGKESQSF
jgi:hypothetical protein